jgi:3-deoxy-D-manno-octulosonic-acid transferase
MNIFYRLATGLYSFLMKVAALWNIKARLIVKGRRQSFERLNCIEAGGPVIWFHCASLGEFEMGRPLMEHWLDAHPEFKLVVTFFSPSGYEFRKDYKRAAVTAYLPADTPGNARSFVSMVKPDIVVFVKYDLWHYYISELKNQKIPFYIISATFRKGHRYFKSKFFRKLLTSADLIFVQDDLSLRLLKENSFENGVRSGDTRCDRVLQIARNAKDDAAVMNFVGDRRMILAGSSWKEEEILLQKSFPTPVKEWCIVIAPHDISEGHLCLIEKRFTGRIVRYSSFTKEMNFDVLLIDNIGMLPVLYHMADVSLVGGGFTGYLHNILEPAAHGVPVLFGPKHHRYHEAEALIRRGGARTVSNSAALKTAISNSDWLETAGNACMEYILEMQGATALIKRAIEENARIDGKLLMDSGNLN